MHLEVPAVPYKELRGKTDGIPSSEIRERVEQARDTQRKRGFYNSQFRTLNCERYARWMRAESGRSRWPFAE